ncbi:type II toxin-antitoxin system RelE/ParE family toxin [Nostoc sp.]|uniref:type II toxin-antitoxin system RelE/ParE family toxin n=1 Tax=Nostoc sp. TaxID=1180 RepID=UPI002FF9826A
MNRYIMSLPASGDLQAIADYFAVENVEAGEQVLYVFNQKCQQLVSFPNMGRQYDDLRPGLRGLPLDGDIIFYNY